LCRVEQVRDLKHFFGAERHGLRRIVLPTASLNGRIDTTA
jgi:hypothetical protein